MPRAPKRCARPECDEKMPCSTHQPANRRQASRHERGYGSEHDAERAAWVPKVDAGGVHCRRGEKCLRYPNTLIVPGKPWHLGHPDAECSTPTAPEHPRCNTSAPGRLRNT